MKKLLLFTAFIALFTACSTSTKKFLPEVIGNPYELLLVADDHVTELPSYDTLRNILSSDVVMINQPEPIYDIVTTTHENFKDIMQKHRNVIFVNVDQKYDSTRIDVERNKYSDGQLLFYISTPNDSMLINYLSKNGNSMIKLLEITEQQRMVKKIEKRNEQRLNDTIAKMFGISIKIPKGYKLRNVVGNDFIWISYEAPISSQGIFIYSYPYDSKSKFTQSYLIAMRNEYASLIPGPSKGSYMTTSDIITPIMSKVVINKREWVEQRGFWNVANDFMGGPFISFSALDKENGRVIVIDEYLYSPKNDKPQRNLLRQLENVVYTVKF